MTSPLQVMVGVTSVEDCMGSVVVATSPEAFRWGMEEAKLGWLRTLLGEAEETSAVCQFNGQARMV